MTRDDAVFTLLETLIDNIPPQLETLDPLVLRPMSFVAERLEELVEEPLEYKLTNANGLRFVLNSHRQAIRELVENLPPHLASDVANLLCLVANFIPWGSYVAKPDPWVVDALTVLLDEEPALEPHRSELGIAYFGLDPAQEDNLYDAIMDFLAEGQDEATV